MRSPARPTMRCTCTTRRARTETEAGKLVCASCNPTGARPVGVEIPDRFTLVASADVWTGNTLPRTFRSGTERRSATISTSHVIYPIAAACSSTAATRSCRRTSTATRTCTSTSPPGTRTRKARCSARPPASRYSERSDGCVGLVSSGEAPGESAFLDASETGGDVFFLSSGQLAPQDYDTAYDVYDAHECTTAAPCFPSPAAVSPSCDTGDSCKAAPSPQPAIYGAPASATFSGAGNLTSSSPVVSKKSVKCAKEQEAQPWQVCQGENQA